MSEETKACPYCGSEIPVSVKKCKYCGEWLVIQEKDKPKSSLHIGGFIEAIICIIVVICMFNFNYSDGIIFAILCLYILLHVYFLPSLIADGKRTQYTPAIFAINLLLGLTLIGWIVSLVWALTLPNLSKNIEQTSNRRGQTKSFTPQKEESKTIQELPKQDIDTAGMADSTKKCPYCAELIPQNAAFCSICETSLIENLSNRVPCIDYTNTTKCISNDETPQNIKQWNWGAFWLSWIWGIGNKSFNTFFALIPYFGFIWMFVCGAKGNEWAWENKKWASVENYNNTQRKWAIIGNSLAVLSIILALILFIFVQNISSEPIEKNQTSEQEEVNYNSNIEERGDIIDSYEDNYEHSVRENQQQKQETKPVQQVAKTKPQPRPQPVTPPKQQVSTKTKVVVPQAKPVQTQQNQEINDFMY